MLHQQDPRPRERVGRRLESGQEQRRQLLVKRLAAVIRIVGQCGQGRPVLTAGRCGQRCAELAVEPIARTRTINTWQQGVRVVQCTAEGNAMVDERFVAHPEQRANRNRKCHFANRGGQVQLAARVGDLVESLDEGGDGFARSGRQPCPVAEGRVEQCPLPPPAVAVGGQDPVCDLGAEVAVGRSVLAVVVAVRGKHVFDMVGMVDQDVSLTGDVVAHDISATTGQPRQDPARVIERCPTGLEIVDIRDSAHEHGCQTMTFEAVV